MFKDDSHRKIKFENYFKNCPKVTLYLELNHESMKKMMKEGGRPTVELNIYLLC